MSQPLFNKAIVQCDDVLYEHICDIIDDCIDGQPIFEGDSFANLIERHCPELYEICKEEGFRFIPSSDPKELSDSQIWFDVIKISEPN